MSIELLPADVLSQMGSVYALHDPRDGSVRYIGKTTLSPEERLSAHIKAARTRGRARSWTWIRGLLRDGLAPTVSLLEQANLASLNECERRWIAHGKANGWTLTNLTDGGDGGMSSETAAATWTPERRERRIAGIKAAWARPEVKAVIRAKLVEAWKLRRLGLRSPKLAMRRQRMKAAV